jgi:apolipoprotein D and lipocalin family protein
MKKTLLILAAAWSALQSMASEPLPIKPIEGFEASRYMGVWYEIARLPNWFEKDLVHVTATYTLRTDGRVDVLNAGYKKNAQGRKSTAKAVARFAGEPDVGHLKVTFFWPFSADYIILDLDKADYQHALVSGRSRKYLWILSRTPEMPQEQYESLVALARRHGFDTDRLYRVPQDQPAAIQPPPNTSSPR